MHWAILNSGELGGLDGNPTECCGLGCGCCYRECFDPVLVNPWPMHGDVEYCFIHDIIMYITRRHIILSQEYPSVALAIYIIVKRPRVSQYHGCQWIPSCRSLLTI